MPSYFCPVSSYGWTFRLVSKANDVSQVQVDIITSRSIDRSEICLAWEQQHRHARAIHWTAQIFSLEIVDSNVKLFLVWNLRLISLWFFFVCFLSMLQRVKLQVNSYNFLLNTILWIGVLFLCFYSLDFFFSPMKCFYCICIFYLYSFLSDLYSTLNKSALMKLFKKKGLLQVQDIFLNTQWNLLGTLATQVLPS